MVSNEYNHGLVTQLQLVQLSDDSARMMPPTRSDALMMMIGTFLGWQACLIAFFLAPFAGLLVGIAQFALRRDDVIPYGPFLCLGAVTVVVFWAPIWTWAQQPPSTGCSGARPGGSATISSVSRRTSAWLPAFLKVMRSTWC